MFYTFFWMTAAGARSTLATMRAMMESLARHGGCQSLTVVPMAGADVLLEPVRELSASMGAAWSDGRDIFRGLEAAFPRLASTHGEYEVRCLLRWPLLRRLLGGTDFRQVWHIDSDMLFYASLEELARDTAGKTFILQGCPAFSSISEPGWFDTYERALRALEESGEPGFRVTREMRARHRERDAALGNASVYGIPPTQDQDLIECLVGEGRLPQDPFRVVSANRFYYMQNPLCLCAWHHLAAGDEDAVFEERGGAISVGERRVPFIHFQADAARYFQAYRRAATLGLARWLPHPMADPRDHASGRSRRYALVARLLAPAAQVDRSAIMRSFLATGTGDGLGALIGALNHLLGRRGR